MKKCSKCMDIKENENFYKDKRTSDGLYSSCKSCHLSTYYKWQSSNSGKATRKKFREIEKNKEKQKKRARKYYENNKEYIKSKGAVYMIEYSKKQVYKEYRKKYRKTMNGTSVQYRLSNLLRSRIYIALKKSGVVKSHQKLSDIGCSLSELKSHLERQFKYGMNWDNWKHDGWHIDHIKPLSKFDLSDREQFLQACHFTNLQPMWAKDNMKKGNKFEEL